MKNDRLTEDCYRAVIVGAGPVGAGLALAISRIDEQAPILLLDTAEQFSVFDSDTIDARIFAINEGSRVLLESLGIWSEVEKCRCQSYNRMHVWDSEGTGSITFDSADLGTKQLGHIVEANLIQTLLLEAVRRQPNIEFIHPEQIVSFKCSHAIGSSLVRAELSSGRAIQTDLICAVDGAHSSMRSMAGLGFLEQDTGQQALVANLKHEKPNEGCAWQIFLQTGPLAFLPLPDQNGQHLSSIVWSLDNDEAKCVKALSDDAFELRVGRAIEERFGKVTLSSGRFSFPLKQRHAEAYVTDGLALVGDAAHSIHPLAGLGANLGFQDVAVLVGELERASERVIPWGDLGVLKRYQRNRRSDNELVLQSMRGFKELFGAEDSLLKALRNIGMSSLNKMPAVKRKIFEQAMMSR